MTDNRDTTNNYTIEKQSFKQSLQPIIGDIDVDVSLQRLAENWRLFFRCRYCAISYSMKASNEKSDNIISYSTAYQE